jgi:MFS family permease
MAATPAWRSPIPGALASRPAFQSVESAADYSLYSLSHANLREQHAPGGVYLYSLFWKARPVDHDLVRESYPTTAAAFAAVVNVIADAGGRIRISIAVHRLGRRLGRRHRRRRISIAVVVDAALIGAFGAAAMVGAFSTAALASAVSASALIRRRRPVAASFVAAAAVSAATFAAAALSDAFGTVPPWPLPPWLLPAPPPRSPLSRPPPSTSPSRPIPSAPLPRTPLSRPPSSPPSWPLPSAPPPRSLPSSSPPSSPPSLSTHVSRQLRVPVGLATPLDRPLPHGLLPPWGAWRVLRQPFEHDPRLFLT